MNKKLLSFCEKSFAETQKSCNLELKEFALKFFFYGNRLILHKNIILCTLREQWEFVFQNNIREQ